MQCSKKSLSWVSVATIALFASLSQNSIAATNVDSGAPYRAPKWQGSPVNTENNGYDMSPEIDPANFTGELRDTFKRLQANSPYEAATFLRIANYDITLADATKDMENPLDIDAIKRAVYAVNPAYDPNLSEKRAQVRKDLADPESELAQINILSDLIRQTDDLAYLARKLPDSGYPIVNYCLLYPLAEFFHPQDIYVYEAKLHQFSKLYDRVGSNTLRYIEGTLQAYKGVAILERNLDNHRIGAVRKLISQINKAYAGTKGRGGLSADMMPPSDLPYLVDSGFVSVKHGYIIPEITDAQYAYTFGIGAK